MEISRGRPSRSDIRRSVRATPTEIKFETFQDVPERSWNVRERARTQPQLFSVTESPRLLLYEPYLSKGRCPGIYVCVRFHPGGQLADNARVCQAGGKQSTWLPPGTLLEHLYLIHLAQIIIF